MDIGLVFCVTLFSNVKQICVAILLQLSHAFRSRVLNLYSLIYPLQISKVKFTPKYFFIFSHLQIPIEIGKNLNISLIKFIPKAG